MPSVDQTQGAECHVFTFKDGLLSPVAHDLELAVERLRIDWSETHVSATFDLGSVRVLHAVVDGRPSPSALSPRDLRKIEQTVAEEVLQTRSHPEARFQAASVRPDGTGYVVQGTLTLGGVTGELTASVRREEARYVAEVLLDQRRFGITPYSAMFGTLKLKPEVRVRVSVPA